MADDSLRYRDAGVNIDTWNTVKSGMGELVQQTATPNVRGGFGQFGGLFDISFVKDYETPILVTSIDGVGTKLKIASAINKHNTVGEDIVNHCINDILVLAAEPLVFLDYIGTASLKPPILQDIITGMSRACNEAGIPLIAGETAEMPGMYHANDYDLVGTVVGVVEEKRIIDGKKIRPGDSIIGLPSSGLHTNGFSLARKIISERSGLDFSDVCPWDDDTTIGEALLCPHKSYISTLPVLRSGFVVGCSHITGGGFQDNINRILPSNCDAIINTQLWEPSPVFHYLWKTGNVSREEMYHAFNMGIGFVLVVPPIQVNDVMAAAGIRDYDPVVVGEIVSGTGAVSLEW